jgi:hypothetical protein
MYGPYLTISPLRICSNKTNRGLCLLNQHKPRNDTNFLLLFQLLKDKSVQRDIIDEDHARICEKADVYLFSHNLSDGQIIQALLKPCRIIPKTIDQLLSSYGRDASICVLPEGLQIIPYICPDS